MNAVYAVKDIEDWETVGLYLGLSIEQLNNVKLHMADYIKQDNERMKIEVMQYWFDSGNKGRTQDEFIAALSNFDFSFTTPKNPFITTTAMCLATEVSY